MTQLAAAMLAAAMLAAASAAAPAAPWAYHGVVFGAGEWSSTDAPLGSARSDESLRAAIASGASAIRLIPTWYTDDTNATSVYRAPNTTAQGPFVTESDAHVGNTIELARSLGASVLLGPIVDPNWALPWVLRGGYPGAACLLWREGKHAQRPANCTKSGTQASEGRGTIGLYFSEREWDAWFESYSAMLLAYARMAQKHGAAVLVVVAEMWAAMVRSSRRAHARAPPTSIRRYPGKSTADRGRFRCLKRGLRPRATRALVSTGAPAERGPLAQAHGLVPHALRRQAGRGSECQSPRPLARRGGHPRV